mgnify:CR=1 FL=1
MGYILTDKGYIEEEPPEGYKSFAQYYNHINALLTKESRNLTKVLLKNKKPQRTLFDKLN